mmetsp:Transcript_291/g.440  ORF Transcript_291/g.440 Transcript_291/m.440 type:complete len:111 (+) Transcript_291:103-435(+)
MGRGEGELCAGCSHVSKKLKPESTPLVFCLLVHGASKKSGRNATPASTQNRQWESSDQQKLEKSVRSSTIRSHDAHASSSGDGTCGVRVVTRGGLRVSRDVMPTDVVDSQ